MNSTPLVSVIVPNYNYARTLGPCLRSVRAQTYHPIEIIVVDDGSTDDSVGVAEAAGVTPLRTPSNGGPAGARNLGADKARGEVLFFLDSDVVLDPDAVANAVRVLLAEPRVGAVCGVYRPEPLFRDRLVKEYRALQLHLWWIDAESEGPIEGLHSAMFGIRAHVFGEIGPFNERLRWTEEQEYYLRLRARYEVRATRAIRGRHDHDASLRVLLAKVFDRARLSARRWRQRGLPGGSRRRALASLLVLAASLVAVLGPAAAMLGPVSSGPRVLCAMASLPLVGAAIALDARTYGYAFRHRGIPFGLYFAVVHLLVNLTAAAATVVGVLQAVLFPGRIRRMYAHGEAQ